ncbi:MAG: N-acetyltransferase [Rhizobiales bacterium]|nr:N-acetyltransferase [Hyphomicrobiales bacterium]
MAKTGALTIRNAQAEDVAAITSIYADHVLHGTASFDTVPRSHAATLDRLNECVGRHWPFLVAEKGGSVVGYAYVTQFRDRPAYANSCENSIYVASSRRGEGVGTALLTELVKEAEARGFRQIIAVIGGGEPASIAVHEKAGFEHAGRMKSVGWKFGRWLDTVYMQRSLGAGDSKPPERQLR